MVVSHSSGVTNQAKPRTPAQHKLPATPGTRTTTVVCSAEVPGDSTEGEHDEVEITPEEALLDPDIGHGLQVSHHRLKNSWEQIFKKYSRHYDDSEVDIIDWRTFEIIESRGHIERLPSLAQEEDHWTELAELEREIGEEKNKKRRRMDDDVGQKESSTSKTARKVMGSTKLPPTEQCRPPFAMPTSSTKKTVLPQDVLQDAEDYVTGSSERLQTSGRASNTHSLSDRSILKTSSKPSSSQKPASGFSSPLASSFTSTSSNKTQKATKKLNFTPTKKLLRISSKPQPTALHITETTDVSDLEDELASSGMPAFLTPRRIFSPTISSSPKPTPTLANTRRLSPKVINTPKPKTTPFKASHLVKSTSTADDLSEDELQSTTTPSLKIKPDSSIPALNTPKLSKTDASEPESEDELQSHSFDKEYSITTPLKVYEKRGSRPILPLKTPQKQNPDIWSPTPDDPFYDPTWHDQHPDGTPQHFPVRPPQPVFVAPTAPAKQTKTPKPKSTTKKVVESQASGSDFILSSPVVRMVNKTFSKPIESPVIRALKQDALGTPRRKEHGTPSKTPTEKKDTENHADRRLSFLDFLDRHEDDEDELLHEPSTLKRAGTPKKNGTPKKMTSKVVKTPKRVVVMNDEVGIVDGEGEGSVVESTSGLRKDLLSDIDEDEHLEPRKWKTQRPHKSLFAVTVSEEKTQPKLKSVVSIEQADQVDEIPEPSEPHPSTSKRLISHQPSRLSMPRESLPVSEELQETASEAGSDTTTSSESDHTTIDIPTTTRPSLSTSSYRTSPELLLFSEMTQSKCSDCGNQCGDGDCTACDATQVGTSPEPFSGSESSEDVGIFSSMRSTLAREVSPEL
ncbi:hypothetical protein BZA77DRAFT_388340 [Pyronema omphalodes]|nr:hypothetical protein BZA77DRAFT_388340 [Pyronema omphalodes]